MRLHSVCPAHRRGPNPPKVWLGVQLACGVLRLWTKKAIVIMTVAFFFLTEMTMPDNNLKLVYIIILALFALIAAGVGAYLSKRALDEKSEGAGWGAIICAIITLTILGGAGQVAGFINIFK